MRSSSFRLLVIAFCLTVAAFVRPSAAADLVDNIPSNVTGESTAIFAEPDPRTGALQESIPIALPPARGLPQPQLALQYNSNWRDREAGYGWGLELPMIERKPLSGFPEFDEDGRPIGEERHMFGGKLLVKICDVPNCPAEPGTEGHPTWADGWVYYRLQTDGASMRFYRSSDRRTWRILRSTGELLELGGLQSDFGLQGLVPSALELSKYDPVGFVRWRLVAQLDPQHPKNVVLYKWGHDHDGASRNLLFLTDIYYTPSPSALTTLGSYAHHVQLDWEAHPYTTRDYLSAERATLSKRLTRIAVASAPWSTVGPRNVVRAYDLTYFQQRTDGAYDQNTAGPLWHHSFLKAIDLDGACAEKTEDGTARIAADYSCSRRPIARLEYSPGNTRLALPDVANVVDGPENAAQQRSVLPYPLDTAIVDFNRDGLPDVVQGWQAGRDDLCVEGSPHDQHTRIQIDAQGQPKLWCHAALINSEGAVSNIQDHEMRNARPILGYLNRGSDSANLSHSLQYQCMDSLAVGLINGGAADDFKRKARFLNRQGSSLPAASGNGTLFWQHETYYPIVARPIALPAYAPGAEPPGYRLGGCNFGAGFDKDHFYPRWSWEPEVDFSLTHPQFVRQYINEAPASTSDIHSNAEPGWFLDIDGDGLVDKVTEDFVAGWDLYWGRPYFTRYYGKHPAPPLGASGSGVGPALVPFVTETRPLRVLMPSRRVRAGAPDGPPGPRTHHWYADVNGDGIVDLVMAQPVDGELPRVRPGNGRGKFACVAAGQNGDGACSPGNDVPDFHEIEITSLGKPWRVNAGAFDDPYGFQFHDVTGDGLADIVVERLGHVYVWVNLDGRRFGCVGQDPNDPCLFGRLNVPPGYANWEAVNDPKPRLGFADMNADGVDDIVVMTKSGVQVVSVFKEAILDTTVAQNARAPRPGLLVRIHNGLGATTSITYRSIQELDLQARANGAEWTHHSPVVQAVVTNVFTTESSVATQGTGAGLPVPFSFSRGVDYFYRDPAFDRWKRQFVGFRSVTTRRSSEQALTETTFWYGPCERDGVAPRPLAGGPTPSVPCPAGSDDETGSTFLSRVGKPVRIDRYVPSSITGTSPRYLWSRSITYDAPITLFSGPSIDHVVTASYQRQIETTFYDPTASVTPGAVQQVIAGGDEIQGSPTQNVARKTRTRSSWYPFTGEPESGFDDGEPGVDQGMKWTRYTSCNRAWQCLTRDVERRLDVDNSGLYAGTGSAEHFEFDSNGDLREVWRESGTGSTLDRRNTDPGRGTAPAPRGSVGRVRQVTLHYNGETGIVDEVRGADGVSPQPCTRLELDPRYLEHPRQMSQFKTGCDSPDPLVTVLAFDRGFAQPVAKTAPDGGMSLVELDPFGRAANIFLPDPSAGGMPELATVVTYRDQAPLSYVDVKTITSNFPSPKSVRQVTLLNGLGEPTASFTKDDGASWVVDSWIQRDPAGRVFRTLRPFTTTQDPTALASTPAQVDGALESPNFDRYRDPFGRVVRVVEIFAEIHERTYGPLTVQTRDREQLQGGPREGAFTAAIFDGRGNVKFTEQRSRDVLGSNSTRITYDGLSRPTRITRGPFAAYSRTMTWDPLGRLIANFEPNTSRDGHAWRYVYDDANRLVGTSDARGCGKNLSYDGLGRVVAEDYSPCIGTQPAYTAEPEVQYAYDTYEPGQATAEPGFADTPELAEGRLVAVRDRASHTRFNYDSRGNTRRISRRVAKPPSSNPSNGDPYVETWFAQRTDFDTAGRVTSRTSGANLPELLVGGESFESYSYSTRGLTKRIASSYGVLVDDIAYDPDGQPNTVQYGDRALTRATFTYDLHRRAETYSVLRDAPADGLWLSNSSTYPTPDPSTTPTSLARFTFAYDLVGNPTRIEDNADASQYASHAWPQKYRDVVYDDLYRVTKVSYGYGPSGGTAPFQSPYSAETLAGDTQPFPLQALTMRVKTQEFRYDALGNTVETNDDLAATYDRSLGVIANGASGTAGPNQLTSANGTQARYDEAGNLVELRLRRQGTCPSGNVSRCDQFLRYDWDEVGQLSRARRWDFNNLPSLQQGAEPNGAANRELQYEYSLGARVIKRATERTGPARERHTIDVFGTLRLDQVEYENNSDSYRVEPTDVHLSLGGGVGHILYDTGLPYVASPVHRFINVGDHLGSAAITIDGETSELVERTTYQAFGALESDTRPTRWSAHREAWKFTGKEEDIEVGLMYFGARYYAPYLGRWASADPLTIHTLGSDLNPYAYVGGRVMSHVDPFGLDKMNVAPPQEGTFTQPNGTTVSTTCNPCASGTEIDFMGRSLEALDRGGTFGMPHNPSHETGPTPGNFFGTPPEILEAQASPDGRIDPDWQRGQQASAAVVGAALALRLGFGGVMAADAAVSGALLRAFGVRAAVVGAGGGAIGVRQQQACTAGGGCNAAVPVLTRGTGGEMLKQAVGHLRAMPAGPERVGTFRTFVQQITQNATTAWTASEQVTSNGTIFVGGAGEALAFDAGGNMFRGSLMQNPNLLQVSGGVWSIAFNLMTPIQ